MEALVRVNAGIEKGQWGHWSGSMGVLKRVNGGVGQGQCRRVNGGIEKGQWAMGVLNNGGSIGVLKKINGGGIGQGQCGY